MRRVLALSIAVALACTVIAGLGSRTARAAAGLCVGAPPADGTRTLANGVQLHLRTSCRDDKLGSTNSGVTVVPFTVAN